MVSITEQNSIFTSCLCPSYTDDPKMCLTKLIHKIIVYIYSQLTFFLFLIGDGEDKN